MFILFLQNILIFLYFPRDGGPLERCSGWGSISQRGEWSCDIHSPRCSPPPIALRKTTKDNMHRLNLRVDSSRGLKSPNFPVGRL